MSTQRLKWQNYGAHTKGTSWKFRLYLFLTLCKHWTQAFCMSDVQTKDITQKYKMPNIDFWQWSTWTLPVHIADVGLQCIPPYRHPSGIGHRKCIPRSIHLFSLYIFTVQQSTMLCYISLHVVYSLIPARQRPKGHSPFLNATVDTYMISNKGHFYTAVFWSALCIGVCNPKLEASLKNEEKQIFPLYISYVFVPLLD